MKLEDKFSKITQVSNFMKTHPVGDELLPVDGHMDRHDKANSHFSQFCETRLITHITYTFQVSKYSLPS